MHCNEQTASTWHWWGWSGPHIFNKSEIIGKSKSLFGVGLYIKCMPGGKQSRQPWMVTGFSGLWLVHSIIAYRVGKAVKQKKKSSKNNNPMTTANQKNPMTTANHIHAHIQLNCSHKLSFSHYQKYRYKTLASCSPSHFNWWKSYTTVQYKKKNNDYKSQHKHLNYSASCPWQRIISNENVKSAWRIRTSDVCSTQSEAEGQNGYKLQRPGDPYSPHSIQITVQLKGDYLNNLGHPCGLPQSEQPAQHLQRLPNKISEQTTTYLEALLLHKTTVKLYQVFIKRKMLH